jgi:hypothetical protein
MTKKLILMTFERGPGGDCIENGYVKERRRGLVDSGEADEALVHWEAVGGICKYELGVQQNSNPVCFQWAFMDILRGLLEH